MRYSEHHFSRALPLTPPALPRLSRHPAPEADDYFGLTLVAPRVVRDLTLTGSLDLANVVGWEDVTSGSERWEVFSVRADGTGGWVRLSLSRSEGAPRCGLLPFWG